MKIYHKSYRKTEKAKSYNTEYHKGEKFKAYRRNYQKQRRKIDPGFKLTGSLRIRLNTAIKRNYKSGSAVKDLGCTIEQLKFHLQSQFKNGMTWDNWTKDGWHIDHIKPLSKFDLTNREELLKACHYTNLQPLWSADNIQKSNKV